MDAWRLANCTIETHLDGSDIHVGFHSFHPNLGHISGKQSISSSHPHIHPRTLLPAKGLSNPKGLGIRNGFYHATMQRASSVTKLSWAIQLLFAIHFFAVCPCASSLSWTLSPFPDVRSPEISGGFFAERNLRVFWVAENESESKAGVGFTRMSVTTRIFYPFLWWEPSFAAVLLRSLMNWPLWPAAWGYWSN